MGKQVPVPQVQQVEMVVEVPQVQVMEKIVEVPQVQTVEKVVQAPAPIIETVMPAPTYAMPAPMMAAPMVETFASPMVGGFGVETLGYGGGFGYGAPVVETIGYGGGYGGGFAPTFF